MLALNRPALGERPMFEINKQHITTDDHGHVKSDGSFGVLSLANAVVSGNHTYHVNDYCVAGWLNGRDFDYRSWTEKGDAWTANDYRKNTIDEKEIG